MEKRRGRKEVERRGEGVVRGRVEEERSGEEKRGRGDGEKRRGGGDGEVRGSRVPSLDSDY